MTSRLLVMLEEKQVLPKLLGAQVGGSPQPEKIRRSEFEASQEIVFLVWSRLKGLED